MVPRGALRLWNSCPVDPILYLQNGFVLTGFTGSSAIDQNSKAAMARRRAAIVGAAAGLSLAPYFWLSLATVGWPAREVPSFRAPAADFVDFYVEESSRIPVTATVAIGSWIIWLVLVVAVVRAACERLDLAAILAVTLAGASTAIYVAAEGVLAWPTIGTTTSEISERLDPGVAQALVSSRDGLHAAAAVVLGVSVLIVSWLLTRSDLWGHWSLAVAGFLAGASACASMVVGPEGLGPGAIMLWGILVAVVLLLGLRRNPSETGRNTQASRLWRTSRRNSAAGAPSTKA